MCRSVLSFVSDEYFIFDCMMNIRKAFYELPGFLFYFEGARRLWSLGGESRGENVGRTEL